MAAIIVILIIILLHQGSVIHNTEPDTWSRSPCLQQESGLCEEISSPPPPSPLPPASTAFLLHQTCIFPLNLDEELPFSTQHLLLQATYLQVARLVAGSSQCEAGEHIHRPRAPGRPGSGSTGCSVAGREAARSPEPGRSLHRGSPPSVPDRVGPPGSIPSSPCPRVPRAPLLTGPRQHCPVLTSPVWDRQAVHARLRTAAQEHLLCGSCSPAAFGAARLLHGRPHCPLHDR